MAKYHLIWQEATNRLAIDTQVPKGWVITKTVEARFWIEAKKKLGFELTPLQQEMFDEKNDSYQAGWRVVRHEQDAGPELRPADLGMQDRLEAGLLAQFGLQ